MQHFATSKLFKVIFTIFVPKNKNWEILFLRGELFFLNIFVRHVANLLWCYGMYTAKNKNTLAWCIFCVTHSPNQYPFCAPTCYKYNKSSATLGDGSNHLMFRVYLVFSLLAVNSLVYHRYFEYIHASRPIL